MSCFKLSVSSTLSTHIYTFLNIFGFEIDNYRSVTLNYVFCFCPKIDILPVMYIAILCAIFIFIKRIV